MKLDDFNWGGSQESVEFFGERVEPQIDEALTPPVETQTEEPEVTPVTEEEELEEDITFFGEDPETLDLDDSEDTPKEETKKKTKTTKVDNYYNSLFQDLKEKGFYENVELEEGQELTAEDLLDLQEEEVTRRLSEWGKENLGDTGADFLKYLRHGGDPSKFIQMQRSVGGLPEGDISDEGYQEHVIRYTLANEGWDAEEIEDRINGLVDAGRLEKVAIKYEAKVSEERKRVQQQLIEEQKAQETAKKKEFENYKKSLVEVAKTKSELYGFKITPSKASKLVENITKPSVRLEDGRTISKFQDSINNILKSPEKTMMLAMLAENDFDFSQLQRRTESEVVRKVKRNIQNHEVGSAPRPGSSLGDITTLADLLE